MGNVGLNGAYQQRQREVLYITGIFVCVCVREGQQSRAMLHVPRQRSAFAVREDGKDNLVTRGDLRGSRQKSIFALDEREV